MAPKEFKAETYRKSTDLIKARFTKIQETVSKIEASEVPITAVKLRALNLYFAEIKKKRADFELNFQRMLESDSETISDSDLTQDLDDINDSYVLISSVIEVLIQPEGPTTPSADSVASGIVPQPVTASVKLPKLDLPNFDGVPLRWVTFINLFDTAIHKNVALSNVAKLQYLLSLLSGEPLNLIKSLNLTAPNYVVAYNLLRERYHNPRRLCTLHLNQLLDLPNVSQNSVKQMRAFVNSFYEHTEALKALNCDISTNANPLLSAHLLRKLDHNLLRKLETFRAASEPEEEHTLPTVKEIVQFLNTECAHIEDASLHSFNSDFKPSSNPKDRHDKQKRVHFASKNVSMFTSTSSSNPSVHRSEVEPCFACHADHKVYKCEVFKKLPTNERFQLAKKLNRCISCLGNHTTRECQSKNACSVCKGRHHTFLHFTRASAPTTTPNQVVSPPIQPPDQSNSPLVANAAQSLPQVADTTVLLGTALVKVTASNGNTQVLRCLLDSGSQLSFITEHAVNLLQAQRVHASQAIVGISGTTSRTKGLVNLNIASLSDYLLATQHPLHILDRISADLPRVQLSTQVRQLTRSFVLADPTFDRPGGVDILLGGALYPLLFTQENHSLGQGMPHLVGTHFGYVVMGVAPCSASSPAANYFVTLNSYTHDTSELHSALQRFWTQEEPPAASRKSKEEELCNQHFEKTHSRSEDGRYMVHLPFKPGHPLLGQSRQAAEKRLLSLERKFQSNPQLHQLYKTSMRDCEAAGHMVKVTDVDANSPHNFLPHHGVLKPQGDTCKLRVVYDASCKTSNGSSLNDVLLTGPKLQTNICDILLHFRTHNIVFTCDIRQMYLQILVHPPDQNFQLVLWRENPSEPIDTYKLTRVTFGVNSSPYLAIRTLHQLAEDEGAAYPQAAEVLRTQTYVDDVISGADTVDNALQLQDQIIKLLKAGGFELRKWSSNAPELLKCLPQEHLETPVFLTNSEQAHVSVLGLHWSPQSDTFTYHVNLPKNRETKRHVLSTIAQIYDPCGFITPCIMLAKCFMQLLWTTSLDWDDPLPPELSAQWQTFLSNVPHLSNITIPRSLQLASTCSNEIHGFCDASEHGYAAVVYIRTQPVNGQTRIRLIIAKSRVAPLKRVTLPRLELCGAHLLAKLVSYCHSIFGNLLGSFSTHLWCDSSVVLTWLQTPSYKLKTYVANRVSQSQELVPPHLWHYIRSCDNPADCASRGILATQLKDHSLWWSGPSWLSMPPEHWPTLQFNPVDLATSDEVKQTPLTVFSVTEQPTWEYLIRYSTWNRLQRITAYILRFINHCRHKSRHCGPLVTSELKSAQLCLFKIIQQEAFSTELTALKRKKNCSARLQRLSPFLDSSGILRVGGRLSQSSLHHDVRHPCILPKKHHVVNLFIDDVHFKHLHSGVQLTLSLLAQQVWILSARSVVRSRIFHCLTCFKIKPRNSNPLMGDLPKPRVTPARAFSSTGTDFGGPFTIKMHNMRSIRHTKAYICIFVCMVTKAVHIEAVTDLSTDAFIASLTRFVSRRGLCTDLYSDCGTNFIGAKNAFQKILASQSGSKPIQEFSAKHGITFHFNPPAAPHHGGLWESAIKNAKHHLRRVLGKHVLTLPQFMTLTTQVEAMLNSRPLTPLSSDPNDLQVLTPGHFLIGAPLASLPELQISDVPDNSLKHWKLVQALQQRIWKRWHQEYLHTVQQRSKWIVPEEDLKKGDLVLIHQDSPSLHWPLARVLKTFPGKDGSVRVVQLKTQYAILTRPAVKVFPLPINKGC